MDVHECGPFPVKAAGLTEIDVARRVGGLTTGVPAQSELFMFACLGIRDLQNLFPFFCSFIRSTGLPGQLLAYGA